MSEPIYTISPDGTAITCHRCGTTSRNRNDVAELYCSTCRVFHVDYGSMQHILTLVRERAERAEADAAALRAFLAALGELEGCGCQFCEVVDRVEELLPAIGRAEQERETARSALRALEQRIAADAEELAALVCGVRHYVRRHNILIGECVAWNVLKRVLGVGESNEADDQRWEAYQQQKGTALANYYRPRVK